MQSEDREAEEEKEDPLVKAKREQEELEQALEAARDVNPNDDPAMKAFYADMKEVDRENQVNRVLGAFKLNPYEMLGLRFDAPEEDISRMYRKKELQDPEKKQRLDFVLQQVKDSVISDWKKAAKDDPASQLAVAVDGLEAVVQKWLATDEFHDAWKMKARDVLAKTEWRRRKMEKDLRKKLRGQRKNRKRERRRSNRLEMKKKSGRPRGMTE
eukprot:jgi/Picre1/28450/NNA_003854.t1